MADGPSNELREARAFIDLPSGVVYLMRTETMRALGGFREDYPVASAEDLDLLFTVWSIGGSVVIVEPVFVEHVGSATADSDLVGKGRIWTENRNRFVSTWVSMDRESFAMRYGHHIEPDHARLGSARAAAYWMSRLFEEKARNRR